MLWILLSVVDFPKTIIIICYIIIEFHTNYYYASNNAGIIYLSLVTTCISYTELHIPVPDALALLKHKTIGHSS